jgi:hypothetical protein
MINFWSKSVSVKAGAVSLALCLLAPAAAAHATQYDVAETGTAEAAATAIQEAAKASGQDDALPVQPHSETTDSISSSVNDGTVDISKDGTDATAVLDGGADGLQLSIGLPMAEKADDAQVSQDGTAVFADSSGLVDVGVQTLEDGAVRALTILNDPQAPTRYDYQIDVDGGIILKPTDDGAIARDC